MYRKEKALIFLRAAKKVAVPFALLVCLITYVFATYFGDSSAYATEQVANVVYSVNLVENDNISTLDSGDLILTNDHTEDMSLTGVDVRFTSASRLEFDYLVENLVESDCLFTVVLNENSLENMLVEYEVGEDKGVLTSKNFVVQAGQNLKIKVSVSILNPAKDAILDGFVGLTMVNLGGI